MITYRQATLNDTANIAKLGLVLYSGDNDFVSLEDDANKHLNSDLWGIFLALFDDIPIGFCEISLRSDYVEGTCGGIVGYLEGVLVLPEYRNQGIAKTLVKLGESWAKAKGCKEFASDCQLSNLDSYNFHLKIGFKEVAKIVNFIKKI